MRVKYTNLFVQVKIIHKSNIEITFQNLKYLKSHLGKVCSSVSATSNIQQKIFHTICKVHVLEKLNFTLTCLTHVQQEPQCQFEKLQHCNLFYSTLQKWLVIKDTKPRYMEGTDFQIMGVLHLLKTISWSLKWSSKRIRHRN